MLVPTAGDTFRRSKDANPAQLGDPGRFRAGLVAALAIGMTKKLEALSEAQLVTATGGAVSARWLTNHPYAADAYLAHHPNRAAAYTANHPWAAARMHRIAG